MLLFAPSSIPSLDRLSSAAAARPLPRHLQLLAVLRSACFTAHGLQPWLPGAGLPEPQRRTALLHAVHACLPPVAQRLLAPATTGRTSAAPSSDAPFPAFQPDASAIHQHARARVRAQQTITPQVPMQQLFRYLQHHLAYSEGTFAWLLHQHGGLNARSLTHRLAGAGCLWQALAERRAAQPPSAEALADVRAAMAHEKAAILALSPGAMLRWQLVLAEMTVAAWEARDAVAMPLAAVWLPPSAAGLARAA